MHSVVPTWPYEYILQCSKSPKDPFFKVLLTFFPCSLRCRSSRLRSASKNPSLRKTVTPPSLVCELHKLADLHRIKLTYDLRQLEMWHSKFGNPRKSSLFACESSKLWLLIFLQGGINVGIMGLFWFCMSCVSASKQSHQEVYSPSFRLTVNFLASSPTPLTPISFEATLPLRAEGAQCLPRDGCTFQGHPWFLAVPQGWLLPGLKCPSFAAETAVLMI